VLADATVSLAPLLGQVASVGTNPATTVHDPVMGQAQLFADLLGAFGRAAGDRVCVVVIEDLHLATPSTVEWVQYALRRGRHILLVATRRPVTDVRTTIDGADHIHLGPLGLDDVVALVGTERAPDLFERSGGHPLFLVELASAGSDELPASIREAAAARVDDLGAATAATLRAAAILGSDVDVDLLAGVLGEPVAVLLEHLDAGIAARVLDERAAVLAFGHELVREALDAGTSAPRRAFVHREAARVLDDRPRTDPLKVAWHAQRGGDIDRASAALIRAAAIARDRYDAALADDLLGQAITLTDTVDARLVRARVRMSRWQLELAREDAARALELGAGARGLEVAAWVEYYARDYDLAFRYGEEAVARSDDAAVRASCLALTGRVLHAKGELAGAEDRLVGAVDAAPPAVRGYAQTWLGALRTHQGRLEEATDLLDRAHSERRWLGHPFTVHHANFARLLTLGHRGHLTAALAAYQQAHDVAAAAGDAGARFVLAADNAHSWLLRSVGRIAEADDTSQRVFDETMADGGPATAEMRHAAMVDLVEGRLLSEDLDGAAAAVRVASPVETMHGTMAWHHRQRYWVQQARLALATGDAGSAARLAAHAVEDGRTRGTLRYELYGVIVAGQAAARLGEQLDHDSLDAALAGLDRCAGLESWWLTAELAAASGVDRWWRDAERRAGALVGSAGEHAESLRAWIGTRFSALGR
jgi:tetratricopeptide (TPR) repeat protein